jgi:hypothetical protein
LETTADYADLADENRFCGKDRFGKPPKAAGSPGAVRLRVVEQLRHHFDDVVELNPIKTAIIPALGSFLGFKSGIWILLFVFGFFTTFGAWFIWAFLLIVVVLVVLAHRCTVRNLARGYAENEKQPPITRALRLRTDSCGKIGSASFLA